MIRRRLYNPAQLTPDELKSSFVARRETLEDMLRLLGEQVSGRPCQHLLLIGPRGMGKTTLGLRFLHAVDETPDLAAAWQPVAFYEESYEISDLGDFWLAALYHLTRATKEARWAAKAEHLARDESDAERLAAYALAALLDFRQESGKRLILFVENLDLVFGQLRDERDVHALRAGLIEHPDILLIGSANAVFDAIRNHSKPFYEFFRLFFLRGLGQEDCLRILEALAEHEGRKEFPDMLNQKRGRLETIRRLTGGNPRLLVLACQMLIESPLGTAFEDLERLIDEQTPYFKARIEELPVQARKVFHCLAERWTPMLARELSVATKLSSSHASAQLRQLVEKGYAKEVQIQGEKRVRYEVGDRFYNIYYLLRFSRTGRDRLERLVAFLHDLFGSTGMRSVHPATLKALEAHTFSTGEVSDWLGVLAGYVAGDREFPERESWRRQAVDLVNDTMGINAHVLVEIERAFASRSSSHTDELTDRMHHTIGLLEAERFGEAESACRKLISETPDNALAWSILCVVLFRQGILEDALAASERAVAYVSPDDSVAMRMLAVAGSFAQSRTALELERLEAAMTAVERVSWYVHPDDPPRLREMAAGWLWDCGNGFARKGQQEKALAIWRRITEYVSTDDSHTLRGHIAMALKAEGTILVELGRHVEGLSNWERVTEYVRVEDPAELRSTAFRALVDKGTALLKLERCEDAIAACQRAAEYVNADDPIQPRNHIATLLAFGGIMLNAFRKYDESESTCRKATDIDPACGEAWWALAAAVLAQNDDARLAEAEDYAQRAVELGPEDSDALHTLSDVLARRGNWAKALELLERAVQIGNGRENSNRPGLTASLIRFVAAGYGVSVKRLMERNAHLAETMEPLWHAVRAALGEELEPLPAEIMNTVTDIRQKFVEERH